MYYLLLVLTFLFCEKALSAEIVLLNETNIEDFVRSDCAVALFCDFDDQYCKRTKREFLKVADTLRVNYTINFGIMDYEKNKWINMKGHGKLTCQTFLFFRNGKYNAFDGKIAKRILINVKSLMTEKIGRYWKSWK